jgi:hypothetical protein
MPTYDIICKTCSKEDEIFRRLADFADRPLCCGEVMAIKLSPVNIQPDNTCYRSQVTGEMITSRDKHRKHLKAHGLIEVGNEKMPENKPKEPTKKERYELRREIAQRLDNARR